MAMGRWEEAEEALNTSVTIDPEQYLTWGYLGNTRFQRGRFDGAIEASNRELVSNPTNYLALVTKANALAAKGLYSEAIPVYREALNLNDGSGVTWFNLGYALQATRDYDGAIQAYRKTLEINPDDADAWIYQVSALLSAGRSYDAIHYNDEVLINDPKNIPALMNKAYALGSYENDRMLRSGFKTKKGGHPIREVVIAGYMRTALSRSRPTEPTRDWFCKMRGDELLAKVLPEVIKRSGINAEEIDDFIVGCAVAVGEQWLYGGRIPIFMANLPKTIAAKFVDQQCGSSMAGIQIGFMEIAMNFADIVLVGGLEHMTRVPMGMTQVERGLISPNMGLFLDPALSHWDMMTSMNMGLTAEKLSSQTKFTRDELDQWGVRSHQLAAKARAEGFLEALLSDPRLTVRRSGEPDPDGMCVLYWMQRAQRGRQSGA